MSNQVEVITLEFKEGLYLIKCSAICGKHKVVRTTPFAGKISKAKVRAAEEAIRELLNLMQSEL